MATSIQKSLEAIISWMREHSPETLAGLNSPASQADLELVETTTGMTLPESFTEFLRIHNGEASPVSTLLGDFNAAPGRRF